MKRIYFKILFVFLTCLISGFAGTGRFVIAQTVPQTPQRILIDASKDGGLWWFPQAGHFDAEQHHQGKAFADSLRQDGAEVVELPRGESVTADKLRGFDLVIRVPAFFGYTPQEAIAYRNSVAAGTRLLIIGGGSQNSDRVAEVFGVHIERRSHFSSLKKWIPHPFTSKQEKCCESVWSGVLRAPQAAVFLAWIPGEQEAPVLGYLPYGKGYVVFSGQGLNAYHLGNSFFRGLIESIGRHSLGDLMLVPAADVVKAADPLGAEPVLIEPTGNSTFPQPGYGEWRFDWEDVPGADSYEIVILGPAASTPLSRVVTDKSELTAGSRDPRITDEGRTASYIADHNLRGWSWRVRAKLSDGSWGPWSREGRFDIQMRNK